MATAQLAQALQAVEPLLKRHRPLARASQQLLADLAVLLSGLRQVVMFDYAPGATPAQLAAALQPLQALRPSFSGCLLHLDGCCYAANAGALLQRLQAAASGASTWPLLVGFQEDGTPAALAPGQCPRLPAQLARLVGALALLQQQQQQEQQAGGAAWPLLDLDGLSAELPAMPTLNGWLLGYASVYVVADAARAAAASRGLSAEALRLFSVRATPPPGLLPRCCDGGELVLLSFTTPEALCDAAQDARVQSLVGAVAAAACDGGGGWRGVRVVACCVGPRPVSL